MSKFFNSASENDSVADDVRAIVPSLAGGARRLSVAKIAKIIYDETDLSFQNLMTAKDVYVALKSIGTENKRLVFRACAESFGVECNSEKLARLTPDRIMALFFRVFDVYPAADDDFVDDENFKRVFPNFGGAVDLNFADVAENLPEKIRDVQSADELYSALSAKNFAEGKIVRDFVERAIAACGINCDTKILRAMLRGNYLPLFFRAVNFHFEPKAAPIEDDAAPEIVNVSFRHFKAIFDVAKKIDAVELDLDISDTLKIFEGNSVTVKDHFYLRLPDDVKIFRGLVGVATLDGKIAAIGHIEDAAIIERGKKIFLPHMIFDWNMIRQEELIRRKTFLAILFPATAKDFFSRPMSQNLAESYFGEVWTLEFNIAYNALEFTDRPLCIDFGTSNTTAGTYDLHQSGEPKLVTFRDVTTNVSREILPTVVYVESCRDGIVNFKYGYEARKEIIDANYNTRASVFFEIKRWINSLDVVEEVVGADGKETARITRREILRNYLLYVIREAEQQYQVKFKRLHMTAPVKLRKKFLDEMKKIFANKYEVEENSLDEGLAIVYHYIAKNIGTDETDGKILILDCGGGTTDLASCNFSVEQGDDWPILRLQTDFESGDSNFGGNNITYRILQMLKIKIAAGLLRNENLPVYDLIREEDDDILSRIDRDFNGHDKIYANFEDEYNRAEDFVPTKFAEYTMKNERLKVKRNFYYLWQLAEAIKVEFFKSAKVNVDFERDKKIFVPNSAEYFLSVRRNGKLQIENAPLDRVEITIREISKVILPDLYALLKTLLAHYSGDELLGYMYRLSGQSCKINKFRDLFKEFVPGNRLRAATDNQKSILQTDSVALKKFCILGSIEYVRDAHALGKYKAVIEPNRNRRIYNVSIALNDAEKILLDREGDLSLKKFPSETGDAEFIVRNENNRVERRILYHFEKSVDTYTLNELIDLFAAETLHSREEIDRTIGDALRDIVLGEESIFCLAALDSKFGYGFNICQILVAPEKNGGVKFQIPKTRRFESYEDENLQTFFNGDK